MAEAVAGERISSEERRSGLAPTGRVCGEPGCATRLSVYNEHEHCALHQPMVVPRMRGKVLED